MNTTTKSNVIVTTPTKGTLDSLGRNKGVLQGEQVISASRGNSLAVSPYELFIEDGFNVREIDENHVIGMAMALKNGQQLPPIEVKLVEVLDTNTGEKSLKVKVIDGHHRTMAYLYAKDKFDVTFDKVPVLVFEGSDRDELIKMVVSTQNRKLTIVERAFAYARMDKQGMKKMEIAEAVNDTPSNVGSLIRLSTAPQALLDMITNKEIAISNVFALMRECSNFDQVLASASMLAEEKKERKSEQAVSSESNEDNDSIEAQDSSDEEAPKEEKPAKKKIVASKFKKTSLSKKEQSTNQGIVKSFASLIPENVKNTGLSDGDTIQVSLTSDMVSMLLDMEERMKEIEAHNKQAEIEQMKLAQVKKGVTDSAE